MNNKKVIVGMSGGVDSSVAAYLLKEQGYDVIGVTYDFWHDDDDPNDIYRNLIDASDAKKVADVIGIPHYAVNYTKQFRKHVESLFIQEYLHARTPNPCVTCNKFIKWTAMLESAREFDAQYVATGHYARITCLSNGRYAIKNSETAAKDQTYVLYNLTQEQLKRTLLPIGDFYKEDIRKIALEQGLPVAQKAESQDICFIDDGDYAGYIKRTWGGELPPEGNFVSTSGGILGRHKGYIHYTIGQRKGLGIAMGHPVFVTEIRPETNEVVIGEPEDVFTNELYADQLNFMGLEDITEVRLLAKIRYSHKGTMCTVTRIDDDRIHVVFDEKVRAVTPGQAVVFYDGDYVALGGTIYR